MRRIPDNLICVLENIALIYIGSLFLLFPLIATIGQYLDTRYFKESVSVLLLFWPGSEMEFRVNLYVWVVTGLMFISFLAGIVYLVKERSLAKVIVITILAFIISSVIGLIISRLTGLTESTTGEIREEINAIIFSLWHNPVWEELVFRGIPLLLLRISNRFLSKKWQSFGMMLYIIVPSLLCGLYHIPGHGIIRFFDTVILSIVFAWMALRFTFFAPLVMHYVADTMLVLNLDKINGIEIPATGWLFHYGNTLNSIFTLLILVFLLLLPILIIIYSVKLRKGVGRK